MPGVIGGKKVPFAYFRVLFKVERVWKGVSGTSVFVTTSPSETSCGYNFKVGNKYLVYAGKAKGQKYLSTGLCSRTSAAQKDLAALGKGRVPAQKPAPKATMPQKEISPMTEQPTGGSPAIGHAVNRTRAKRFSSAQMTTIAF